MDKRKPASRAESNYEPGTRKNLQLDKPSASRGYMSGNDVTWTGENASDHISKFLKDMGLIEENDLLEAVFCRILKENKISVDVRS